MSLDASEPGSPPWWMAKLAGMLSAKRLRLDLLDSYFVGRPPLVGGTPLTTNAFYRFQQIAKTNFAALVVNARRERLAVRAIRTAVGPGDEGDDAAWRMYLTNGMALAMSDLVRYVGTFGEGLIATAMGADGPRFTAEDPRQTIAYCDPVTGETVAAFKLFHDFLRDLDFAILWLPGERWVASKQRKAVMPRQQFAAGPPLLPRIAFEPSAFTMMPFAEDLPDDQIGDHPAMSERYALQRVPVEAILNRDGVGEFEVHIDLLDRINHTVLQRVVIAALQAFKQRALKIDKPLPTKDVDGNPIDYDQMFVSDPGALWTLPPGAEIWESMEVNLQGVLDSIKADVLTLAAVTRTPLSMFTPDAATQTAEGAQLQREGLVFSVEDLQRLIGRGLARAVSTAYTMLEDAQRADLGSIIVEWLPAERYSLAERADADSKARSLTWEQRQRLIWQQTPTEVEQARIQREADIALLNTVTDKSAPRLDEG